MKRSGESVPLPSCWTKSCWTYCFHTSALECMSMRTRGYGSYLVGLSVCDIQFFLEERRQPKIGGEKSGGELY
jgi:hypothetical protein